MIVDCFRKYARVNNLVYDIKGHVIKNDLQHDKTISRINRID